MPRRISLLKPAAVYLLAFPLVAWFCLWAAPDPPGFTAWNAHHGLAFGCLLRYGLRFTPYVALSFFAEYWWIKAPSVGLFDVALASVCVSISYAAATGTYVRTRQFQQEFAEVRDVSWFLAAAGVASFAAACGMQAVTSPDTATAQSWFELSYALWIADLTGVIVIAPWLLVHLARAEAYVTAEFWRSFEPLWQLVCFGIATTVILAGTRDGEMQYFYLAFVPLIWVSTRYGVAGATIVTLAIQCALVIGLHVLDGEAHTRQTLQSRMLALAIAGLYLGVAISERRSIRNALRRREAELRAVLQGAPDAIFTIDERGHVLGVNQAAEHLFGADADALNQQSIVTLFPDFELERLDGVSNHEIMAVRADGSRFETELSLRRVRVATRDFSIGIARDVSRRKAFEHGIEMQRLEIQRSLRMASAGELATTIAHELNQPLSAIRGYARASQLLADDLPRESERLRTTLSKIHGEAERAGQVVRRLREFFRSGALVREMVDLAALTGEVVRAARESARAGRVELVFTCRVQLPPIAVDRLQIETVLHNLIANALEAIAEHGSEVRRIELELTGSASMQRLVIDDSGPGIATDMLPRVFEPFVTSKPSGMGLGLAICRSMIEAHGGDITIGRGRLGGACIRVLLPASAPDAALDGSATPTSSLEHDRV